MVCRRTGRVLATTAAATVLLSGCSGMQQPEVERVATTFDDPSGDPGTRCDLLAPATLAALEKDRSAPCAEVVHELPLDGGEVAGVEIWAGEAQVKLAGDTLFLTETDSGWRVVAAGCTARGEAPYDCEVEGP